MLVLIFILFVAGFSWWLGRSSVSTKSSSITPFQLNKNYFKGLNYLLNEENDKALDIFIKSMSVDGDTIETHLALGGLFRRRGELTRAIRIHQNLLARPTLTLRESTQAQLALAYDYLAAGMLDRAEKAFLAVATQPEFEEEAWYRLLDIYQREKRWFQAIDIAGQLQTRDPLVRLSLAHHYCELAQLAIKKSDFSRATALLVSARKHQRRLARIDLLMGEVYYAQSEWAKALQAYQLIVDHDEDYLSEAIPKIVACYEQLQAYDQLEIYLSHCQAKTRRTITAIELTKVIMRRSPAEACAYLNAELKTQPSLRGVLFLIELHKQENAENYLIELQMFYDLAQAILKRRAYYRCNHCGFSGRILFWQCPSCKRWSTMKPIHGIEGD